MDCISEARKKAKPLSHNLSVKNSWCEVAKQGPRHGDTPEFTLKQHTYHPNAVTPSLDVTHYPYARLSCTEETPIWRTPTRKTITRQTGSKTT